MSLRWSKKVIGRVSLGESKSVPNRVRESPYRVPQVSALGKVSLRELESVPERVKAQEESNKKPAPFTKWVPFLL